MIRDKSQLRSTDYRAARMVEEIAKIGRWSERALHVIVHGTAVVPGWWLANLAREEIARRRELEA